MTIRIEITDSRGRWEFVCETINYASTSEVVQSYHDATGFPVNRIRATVV